LRAGRESAVESPLPVLPERAEPDVLLQRIGLVAAVVAAAPLGRSDADLARGPVDAAAAARNLHEGLAEHGRCAVTRGPVLGQPPADERENVGPEIRNRHPGKDQESRVVDHRWEVPFARPGADSPRNIEISEAGGIGNRSVRLEWEMPVSVSITNIRCRVHHSSYAERRKRAF